MNAEERKERENALQRYEEARRNHLGRAINLVFGLATAAAGFCVSHICAKDSQFSRPGSYYFVSATCVFLIVVGVSIGATWTRLRDFRLTAKTIRRELEAAEKSELDQLRSTTHKLGQWTWALFYGQLGAFAVAVVLLAIALVYLYSDHIFPCPKG